MRRFTALAVMVAAAASLLGVLAYGGGNAHAVGSVTITATATGSPTPTVFPLSGPCQAPNGAFTINTDNVGVLFPCGDGTNEFTNWTFNFDGPSGGTQHAQYVAFLACLDITPAQYDLTSARLRLKMNSPSNDTSTDSVRMIGKGLAASVGSALQNTKIQTAIWPGIQTITHDWVTAIGEPGTNAAAILANFLGSGNVTPFNAVLPPYAVPTGQIAMEYQDDAIISYAELQLSCGLPVGGAVDILTNTDSADSAADVSGSSIASDFTSPVAAAIAAGFVALMVGGWYVRRRWVS